MWMYLQWLHSQHINAYLRKIIKHYSHFCHPYIEKQTGFFYHHVRDECKVKGSFVTLKTTVTSYFYILWFNDSISFVDLIFTQVYWCFHCLREAAAFSRQSFPLALASILVNSGGKTLWVWNKNVKHAEMAKHKRATTTSRGTWADPHHLFYRYFATSKNSKFKNNYITATCGSWLQVLAILTSFNHKQRRAL